MNETHWPPSQDSLVSYPRKPTLSRESFREIGRLFAKDNSVVLSTRGVLKGVSPADFALIGEYAEPRPHSDDPDRCAYAGNAECAYFASSLDAPKKLATKAPQRVVHLGKRYASDGTLVFHDGNKVEGADASSFEVLSSFYARDAKHCYFRNKRIDGADPATFRLVCPTPDDVYAYCSADADSAYHYEYLIPGAAGATFELVREDGRVVGATDGTKRWTWSEIVALMPQRKKRALVLASASSAIGFHENLFQGLEQRLATFCLLCHEGSVEAFEKFTRGRIGENSIVRSMHILNERLPSPIAEVNRDEIRITPAGAALYRQFSEPIKGVRSVFDNIDAIVKAAME